VLPSAGDEQVVGSASDVFVRTVHRETPPETDVALSHSRVTDALMIGGEWGIGQKNRAA